MIGQAAHAHADDCEYPPAFHAEIILAFDYQGVKKTDDQKGAEPQGEAQYIVFLKELTYHFLVLG